VRTPRPPRFMILLNGNRQAMQAFHQRNGSFPRTLRNTASAKALTAPSTARIRAFTNERRSRFRRRTSPFWQQPAHSTAGFRR